MAALFLFEAYTSLPGAGTPGVRAATPTAGLRVEVSRGSLARDPLDWLSWTVRQPGERRVLRAGELRLASRDPWPVDFTAASSRDATGSVEVEVVGRQGGKLGSVRARRRVTVDLAKHRGMTLRLRLEPRPSPAR